MIKFAPEIKLSDLLHTYLPPTKFFYLGAFMCLIFSNFEFVLREKGREKGEREGGGRRKREKGREKKREKWEREKGDR